MEYIAKYDGWNNIEWEGVGFYVANRLRGPMTYIKLPDGATPIDGVVKTYFHEKPKKATAVTSNGLWIQ